MKRKSLFIATLTLLVGYSTTYAQNNVGIGTNTPNPNAVLEMQSTTQGVLVPRMTTVQRNAIVAPTEGLLVYDIDVNCFFFYESTSSTWLNLCNAGATGPQGPAGPAGPQGPAGATGATGPAGAAGTPGTPGATGPQGPAGAIGATGPQGPQGSAGNDGVDGATGPAGPQGPAGNDGVDGATGPQGPIGPQGPAGTNGVDGATGPAGPIGATGPAGPAGNDGAAGATGATGPQGPSGIITKYYVSGTAPRTGVSTTTFTTQPGLTQTFTLTASSTILITATIGGLIDNTTTTSRFINIDAALVVDGGFLPNGGGYSRFSIVNGTNTNCFNTTTLHSMITLPAGTHTIELMTLRSGGSAAVTATLGGNAVTDTNPGEMTILVLN